MTTAHLTSLMFSSSIRTNFHEERDSNPTCRPVQQLQQPLVMRFMTDEKYGFRIVSCSAQEDEDDMETLDQTPASHEDLRAPFEDILECLPADLDVNLDFSYPTEAAYSSELKTFQSATFQTAELGDPFQKKEKNSAKTESEKCHRKEGKENKGHKDDKKTDNKDDRSRKSGEKNHRQSDKNAKVSKNPVAKSLTTDSQRNHSDSRKDDEKSSKTNKGSDEKDKKHRSDSRKDNSRSGHHDEKRKSGEIKNQYSTKIENERRKSSASDNHQRRHHESKRKLSLEGHFVSKRDDVNGNSNVRNDNTVKGNSTANKRKSSDPVEREAKRARLTKFFMSIFGSADGVENFC